MWIWQKIIKPVLEWIGHAETLHTIAQAEFFRTLFWPGVATVTTAITGVLGGIPVMWVIVGSAVAFMATSQGLLRASEYLERKNPLNKLSLRGAYFTCDLTPAPLPLPPPSGNRRQRRARRAQSQQPPSILTPSMINPGVPRNLDKGQLSVELKNNASFPISCILYNAATEVAGMTPPRTTFPKIASTVQPGNIFRITDDAINMNGLPCGRLAGKINMIIKYGLPGKERFELRLNGTVDIVMENFGIVTQVNVGWMS